MAAIPAWALCFTLLLSLASLCCCSTSCSTAELAHSNLLDDYQCTTGNRMENNGVSKDDLSKGIKLELNDSNPDILTVTFPLGPAANFSMYVLELYVALYNGEDLTEEKCSQINFTNKPKHSSQYFDIYSCKELDIPEENCTSTCSATGVVQFRHIFTGCYEVKFSPKRNGGSLVPYRSKKTVLRNNFGLQRLIDLKPIVQHIPTQKERKVIISIRYPEIENVPLSVRLMGNVQLHRGPQACSLSGREQSCCVYYRPSHELQCEVANVSTKTPSCKQEGVDLLKCTFYNVSAGNYCLTMEVEDPVRCTKGSSVWKPHAETHCLFFYNFTLAYSDNLSVEPSTVSSYSGESYVVVICAVIALIILAAVIFIGLRFCRAEAKKAPPSYLLPLSRQSSEIQPQVLLLYAQDCQPFMKLMTTFRVLLTNVGNCEVFDCFDPARTEEIALSPIEWMRYRVNNPTVKVVVVANDCAVAHQKALETGIKLQYRQPLPYNMLFQQGLKTLTYDSDHKEYLKNFVVSFDDKALHYVTPFTRFNMPLHLLELLRNLNQGISDLNLQESKDVQRLKDDLSDYLLYKRQNSSYLSNLMMRSSEAV